MPDLTEGQSLGPYRLVSRIGAGGFAEIWLAIASGPLGFEKKVALKILRAGTQVGERHFRSLVNEARLAGHLHHPHIVDFYGVAREGGLWFMAMEYVDGRSLRGLMRELDALGVPLPHSVVLDVGIQIARALTYAHEAVDNDGVSLSVIHRDLKPANILVARHGGVKIADFGIASAATNLQSLVGVKGTLAYMAPEYWAEDPTIGPAVDLFALGAVLYELVTGDQLFDGANPAEIEDQALNGDPAAEAARAEERFPALAPILRRLLDRDPDARPRSAARVASALVALRERRGAPGDIAQFLQLLDLAQMPRTARRVARAEVHVPRTEAAGWSQLARVIVGGTDTLGPRTEDWVPTVEVRPTHETWEFSEGRAPMIRPAPPRRLWLVLGGVALGVALTLAALAWLRLA